MTTPEPLPRQRPFKHFLKEWRIHRGLSQAQLALRLGSSKGVISRYESGDRAMSLETQFALMRALNITPSQFFLHPEQPSADALLENASPSERQRVIDILHLALGRPRES